jgi:hypothetical protein
MGALTIGIDIGQKADPTAIAVVEAEVRNPGPPGTRDREELHFLARHLERLPLGTPYPEVASRLKAIVAGARERGGTSPQTYLDATGVGQPVADVLKTAGVRVTCCYFTHGDRRTVEDGAVTIGKGFLVSRLKALAQTGRLHLPRTAEALAMQQELLDYEIRVDADANERYGAFRVGAHDDLVTALGLAVQTDPLMVGWLVT